MTDVFTLYTGNVLDEIKKIADKSVRCIVTSTPYYGLRDYGTAKWVGGDKDCDHKASKPDGGERGNRSVPEGRGGVYKDVCGKCGAKRVDEQIGLEETPEAFVEKLVTVFRECRRVLTDDGTLWLNLGDSYNGSGKGGNPEGSPFTKQKTNQGSLLDRPTRISGLKPKDLIGIPWMVAFALRADGWYLRSEIIWCLSGGAWVYAKTQKGVAPMMIRDLARLDPKTVELWNGEKWTRLLGMSKSARRGDELEIVLRSGERISCTPTHKFPTKRGLLEASDLQTGDIIQTCALPDVENPRDCALDEDAAWLAGLYVAEGSRSDDTIQIAGHAKETSRWERVQKISAKFGGSCARTVSGNQMNIRVHGKVLNSIIDEFVTGRTAKDKGFSPSVWKYSNRFIAALLEGYLSGDGHWEPENRRWRLGFTRNYNLERDLRTACARLGYTLTLKTSTVPYNGKDVPTFRGELRTERSGHWNERDMGEIIEIRKAKCREVYDLGVEDEPHLFALASGVLTHNSKPNPMPESVTDRPTRAHEQIFLLSKSKNYYYDYQAILEPANYDGRKDLVMKGSAKYANGFAPEGTNPQSVAVKGNVRWKNKLQTGRTERKLEGTGTAGDDTGLKGHSGYYDADGNPRVHQMEDGVFARNKRTVWNVATKPYKEAHFATFPPELIEPCILAGSEKGDIVLDPFSGSGTTGYVAVMHNRRYYGIDLNPEYNKLARKRILSAKPMLFGVERINT